MAKGSTSAFSLKGDIQLYFSDKSLKAANKQIQQSAARIQGHSESVKRTLGNMAVSAGSTFGLVAAGFGAGAAAAARFEESFVAVKKTLNIAGDTRKVERGFQQIAKSLLDLTKIAPVTADELNQIASVGGQLGIAASDIVKFTQVIQKLTIATNMGAEQAALAMARLQEITGRGVDELDNLGATLVDLGNNFAATESEITNASLQIATATAQVAGNLNNAAVDALAFSTALRAIGQPAQAGATAIVRLMTEMSKAVTQGGEKLEIFATTAGLSVGEFQKLFSIDSTKAIAMFVKGLDQSNIAGMTNIEVMERLGLSQVRTRKAILALSKANETLFEAIDTANNAFIENRALNEEAARRYDTLFSKIQQLKNIAQAGLIDFGLESKGLDLAKDGMEGLLNITQQLADNIDFMVKRIIPIVGVATTIRGIFGVLNKNTIEMANNMGLFDEAMQGIKSSRGILENLGFAVGPAPSMEELQSFGMAGLRGSQLNTADKVLERVPGVIGKLFNVTTGSARREQNQNRVNFFTQARGADAYMQGVVPQIKMDKLVDIYSIQETIAKSLGQDVNFEEILSSDNVLSHLINTRQDLMSQLTGRMDPTGDDIIARSDIQLSDFSEADQVRAMNEMVAEYMQRMLNRALFVQPDFYDSVFSQINQSLFNLFVRLEGFFGSDLKQAMARTLQVVKGSIFGRTNPMVALGKYANAANISPLALSQAPSMDPEGIGGFGMPGLLGSEGGVDVTMSRNFGQGARNLLRDILMGNADDNIKNIINASKLDKKGLAKYDSKTIMAVLEIRRKFFAAVVEPLADTDFIVPVLESVGGGKNIDALRNIIDNTAFEPEDVMKLVGNMGFRYPGSGDVPTIFQELQNLSTEEYLKFFNEEGLVSKGANLFKGLGSSAASKIKGMASKVVKFGADKIAFAKDVQEVISEIIGKKVLADLEVLFDNDKFGIEAALNKMTKDEHLDARFAEKDLITTKTASTLQLITTNIQKRFENLMKEVSFFFESLSFSITEKLQDLGLKDSMVRKTIQASANTVTGRPSIGGIPIEKAAQIAALKAFDVGGVVDTTLLEEAVFNNMDATKIVKDTAGGGYRHKLDYSDPYQVLRDMGFIGDYQGEFNASGKSYDLPVELDPLTGLPTRDGKQFKFRDFLDPDSPFKAGTQIGQIRLPKSGAKMNVAGMSLLEVMRIDEIQAAIEASGKDLEVTAENYFKLMGKTIEEAVPEDTLVEIFRGVSVPKDRMDPERAARGQINDLDWITTNRGTAEFYAKSNTEKKRAQGLDYEELIMSQQVKASEIFYNTSAEVSAENLTLVTEGFREQYKKITQQLGFGKTMIPEDVNLTLGKYTEGFNNFIESIGKSLDGLKKSASGYMKSFGIDMPKSLDKVSEKFGNLGEKISEKSRPGIEKLLALYQGSYFGEEAKRERLIARQEKALMKANNALTLYIKRMIDTAEVADSYIDDIISSDLSPKAINLQNLGARSDKEQLDDLLDSIYGETGEGFFGNRARKRRRSLAAGGSLSEVNAVIAAASEIKDADFTSQYVTSGGKTIEINKGMVKSFKAVASSMGKVRALIAAFTASLGLLGVAYLAIAPLVKLFAKFGAQSRGLNQFTNSLREATQGMLEYRTELFKLSQAQEILETESKVFGFEGSEMEGTLNDYIKKQTQAIESQRRQMAETLGASYIENIAENVFSGSAGVQAGSYTDTMIEALARGFKVDESEIRKRLGRPVGETLFAILEGDELPTFDKLLEGMLFDKSDTTDDNVLSAFFSGATREMLESSGVTQGVEQGFDYFNQLFTDALTESFVNLPQDVIKDSPYGEFVEQQYEKYANMAGQTVNLDPRDGNRFLAGYGELLGEINSGIASVYRDYTSAGDNENFFADLASGQLSGLGMGHQQFIQAIIDDLREEMPDATDEMLGIAATEIMTFGEIFGSLTGKTFQNFSGFSELTKQIGEDSAIFEPLQKMLMLRLEELEAAGYITFDQLMDASKDFETAFNTFKNAEATVEQERIDMLKKLNEEMGISADMSMKLAIKMDEAFKKMRSSLAAFGTEVAKQQFTRETLGDLLKDIRQQRLLQEEYEANVKKLRALGFEMTADRLLAMGPSGNNLAQRLISDQGAAVLIEEQFRALAPKDATELGIMDPLADGSYLDKFQKIGLDIAKGIELGIKDGYNSIMDTFTSLGQDIIEKLKKAVDSDSPSMASFAVSQDILKGMELAIAPGSSDRQRLIDGFFKLGQDIPEAIADGVGSANLNVLPGPNPVTLPPDFMEQLDEWLQNNPLPGMPSGFYNKPLQKGTGAGLAEGYKSKGLYLDTNELVAIANSFGMNLDTYLAPVIGNEGATQAKIDELIGMVYDRARTNISDMQEAFSLVTDVTNAERSYNQSILNVLNSKQALAATLRTEASLQDRIAETKEKLDKLEIEGRKDNVTVKERIGILQQLLSLREKEKKAAGEYDARTALSIQEKEQEVANLALMYDRGVITQLDFQAAQEELAELKGEFKTDEDKELFFLQLADAQTEYDQAVEDAKKVDKELISTREEYIGLLDEQERKQAEVTVAQDSYSASLEGVVSANMNLNMAILNYNENAPMYLEEMGKIKNMYGEITGEVDALIEAVQTYAEEQSKLGIDSAGAVGTTADDLAEDSMDTGFEESMNQAGAQQLANTIQGTQSFDNFIAGIGSFLGGYGLDKYGEDLIAGGSSEGIIDSQILQNQLLRDSGKQVFNPRTQRFEDTATEGEKYLPSGELDKILRGQDLMDNVYSRGNKKNFEVFLESFGLNVNDGAISQRNLDFVVDKLGKSNPEFDVKGMVQDLVDANLIKVTSDLFPGSTEMPEKVEEEKKPTADNYPVGHYNNPYDNWTAPLNKLSGNEAVYYNTNMGRLTGNQIRAMRNMYNTGSLYSMPFDDDFIDPSRAQYGMRLPDFKIPQFKHGGRMQDHMMKRALVGEYGPEEVRFVPGSGFLVKPLTQGGRGNNTIVQSLSVNVTGIPVDNASARKAAVEIKKALQRLDREGRAGGGIRNT